MFFHVPRQQACEENTIFASGAHMTLTAVELVSTSDIAFHILLDIYPKDLVAVHISSNMWNYLTSLGIAVYHMLEKVLIQQLNAKCATERMQSIVNNSFSRSNSLPCIETPTAQHFRS